MDNLMSNIFNDINIVGEPYEYFTENTHNQVNN